MKRLLALAALLFVVGACEVKEPPATFLAGDVCTVKITGERVMVTSTSYDSFYEPMRRRRYWYRIGGLRQQRRDGFVSADTELAAYTKVMFYEFELERAGEE